MLFGKHVLLPMFGYTLFSWLAGARKNLHNFVAPLFIVSVLVMFFMFAARQPAARVRPGNGSRKAWAVFARGEHVPSGRFNAGEKVWFWVGVVVLSIDRELERPDPAVPELRPDARGDAGRMDRCMRSRRCSTSRCRSATSTWARSAWKAPTAAMRTGYVDETWAKEHHEYWYDEVKSGRRATATRFASKPLREGEASEKRSRDPDRRTADRRRCACICRIARRPPQRRKLPPQPKPAKDAAVKAREAKALERAQDKAVANYRKSQGSSSARATRSPRPRQPHPRRQRRRAPTMLRPNLPLRSSPGRKRRRKCRRPAKRTITRAPGARCPPGRHPGRQSHEGTHRQARSRQRGP